jgi:hypothetical protein
MQYKPCFTGLIKFDQRVGFRIHYHLLGYPKYYPFWSKLIIADLDKMLTKSN